MSQLVKTKRQANVKDFKPTNAKKAQFTHELFK
jgi:hypothetical protein